MPDVIANTTGAFRGGPRGFRMSVAFITVIGAGKTLGRTASHRE